MDLISLARTDEQNVTMVLVLNVFLFKIDGNQIIRFAFMPHVLHRTGSTFHSLVKLC